MRKQLTGSSLAMLCLLFMSTAKAQTAMQEELPNILWLTSEDNSPLFGCYGDEFATTPNLDRLAKQGFLYTHAYANAPVCAPSRNTIITGVYASAAGNDNMRSSYPRSAQVRLFPEYLKGKGYYCTNNFKKDYNFSNDNPGAWNESGKTAHYKNRKSGQPFFAVFNNLITHESCLHGTDSLKPLRHDPGSVKLAPYHPDTKAMRRDYAKFYDAIEAMDAWIGEKLQELDEAGLSENTIVIYYADHGGILGRSKRFIYETGTRIPFIVRIPEKYKLLYPGKSPGSSIDRLISLVDLAPTMLSIAGMPIPGYLQGRPFLGTQKSAAPKYIYMFRGRMDESIDMSRAVRDQRYRYIRNYMPYRKNGQHINYLWKAPSMQSWEQAYVEGKCNEVQSRFFRSKPVEELYDTQSDPWEINNLAGDPAYKKILLRMRQENNRWMAETRDAGFIPEGLKEAISKKMPLYDYMRSNSRSINEWLAASNLANFATAKDISKLRQGLLSKDGVIRYWAACGLLQSGDKNEASILLLKKTLNDTIPDVAITAAEALCLLGYKSDALTVLFKEIESKQGMVQVHALAVIENTCEGDQEVKAVIADFLSRPGIMQNEYSSNIARRLLKNNNQY